MSWRMVGGMGCTSQESSSISEVAWVTMVGSSVVAGGMGLLAVRRLLLLRFWVLDKPRFSAEGMGS